MNLPDAAIIPSGAFCDVVTGKVRRCRVSRTTVPMSNRCAGNGDGFSSPCFGAIIGAVGCRFLLGVAHDFSSLCEMAGSSRWFDHQSSTRREFFQGNRLFV